MYMVKFCLDLSVTWTTYWTFQCTSSTETRGTLIAQECHFGFVNLSIVSPTIFY